MKVYLFDKAETTEAMKIFSTSFYGLLNEYNKDVKRWCDKNKVPYEAWTLWTQNYNEGYKRLGYPEYTRPLLVPIMRKLGGHCLLPNCDLLKTEFSQLVKRLNQKYG